LIVKNERTRIFRIEIQDRKGTSLFHINQLKYLTNHCYDLKFQNEQLLKDFEQHLNKKRTNQLDSLSSLFFSVIKFKKKHKFYFKVQLLILNLQQKIQQ
jgi:hypothetical protein